MFYPQITSFSVVFRRAINLCNRICFRICNALSASLGPGFALGLSASRYDRANKQADVILPWILKDRGMPLITKVYK